MRRRTAYFWGSSGHYLALARWAHGGLCFNFASVVIIDLGSQAISAGTQDTLTIANFGVPATGVAVLNDAKQLSSFIPVQWRSQSELEVTESVSRTDDCTSPIRTIQRIIDVGGLTFAASAP